MITLFAKSRDAYHGSDCAYVFGHLTAGSRISYTDEDLLLSRQMMDYWLNFIKTGDPNGPALPEWPVFSGASPAVMYLHSQPTAGPYPNTNRLHVLDSFYHWKRRTGRR